MIKSINHKNLILAVGSWNKELFISNKKKFLNFKFANNKKELNYFLKNFNIKHIFIIHWHDKISKKIIHNYNCISFHMTDLPYGVGGSPIQNLILRGHYNTILTAFKTDINFDEGDIIMKRKLSLKGTASEILIRSSKLAFKMIEIIILKNIKPMPQVGQRKIFKRRKPSMSEINFDDSIKNIYDFIRMLDGPIYPKAFLSLKKYKLEFYQPKLKSNLLSFKVDLKIK